MFDTEKNTVISPNFLVCKFCGKAQFPHSFGRFAMLFTKNLPFKNVKLKNCHKTVPLHKITVFLHCEVIMSK